jgi:hypothetical protein
MSQCIYFYFIKEFSLHCRISRFIFLVLKCNDELATRQKIWEMFERRIHVHRKCRCEPDNPYHVPYLNRYRQGRVARDFPIVIMYNNVKDLTPLHRDISGPLSVQYS